MNENIREYLSDAEVALIAGQYATALELGEKVIAEDENNAAAYVIMGKACLLLEKHEEAEKHLQKAVDFDSTNGERYFDLGNVKLTLGKLPKALACYSKAEKLGCDDEVMQKLYFQLGMINNASGNTKSALINFDKADRYGIVDSDTKEMLIKRILIYIERQDFNRAEDYAIQLKMLAPDDFNSYSAYFQVLIAAGKFDQAEKILEEAENYSDFDSDILKKEDMCTYKAMILTMKAENEPEHKVAHYQSAIAMFDEFLSTPNLPRDAVINITISKADIFINLGNFKEALQCIDSLFAGNEADESTIAETEVNELTERIDFIKLTCYLGLEDYEEAIDCAERLKASSNGRYEYFAIYADAFIARKFAGEDAAQKEAAESKYNNAIAFFKNKAFANPMDLFATVFRVRLYAENGRTVQANELIKILPDVMQKDLKKYVADCCNES